MAIKKTQMYRKNLDTSETNLYPLTESQYVLMENGQTVQEVLSDRDSDKYTPVITNSSSTFKVGQGDNVDLSSSMKEGAYDSCVLKGKSMVNCIQEPSSQDVVLPYEFEDGQYVTINDTKESGALGVELKGQTLVNQAPQRNYWFSRQNSGWYEDVVETTNEVGFTITGEDAGWRYLGAGYVNRDTLKPNTKYLIVCEEALNISKVVLMAGNATGRLSDETNLVNNRAIITTYGELTDLTGQIFYFYIKHAVGNKVKLKNVMFIEYQEGMENWDIPYFTGMTSVKLPILSTTGKNLLPSIKNTWYPCRFKQGTAFKLSTRDSVPSNGGNVVFKDINGASVWFGIDSGNTTSTKVLPCDVYYIMNSLATGVEHQLEIGTQVTSYEPNKTSILSLPEEVVLRSLPNGVCDTFNTRTGVYTQRIGEVVLNGSESWNPNNTEGTTTQRFFCNMLTNSAVENSRGTQQYLCDRLRTIVWNQTCELGLTVNGSGVFVYNNAIEYSASSVKQWLSQNPVRLQYELATPIITKINLPSTLKSWNTTTHIYSEIPENTLYPTLSHSNPSYPVILKPSTKYSIVANSYSNSHTNSAINFNLGGATASTTVGNRVTTITTPSTLSNELLTMSGRGNKLNNVMVIEGDVVGDEPYFEGMCDSKSPILSNVGRNLFNINNHTEKQWTFGNGYPYEQNAPYGDRLKILGDEIHFSTDGGTVNKGVGYYIPLCKNKNYTFRINKKDGNGNYCVKLFLIHSSEYPLKSNIQQHSKFGINNEAITSSLEANFNSANYDMCAIYIGGGWESGLNATRSYVFNNISLTESNQQVEPHKSNTTTFEQKDDKTIVLRSLPNGVCDTLNIETGEYVQRIGEVVKNNSTGFRLSTGGWENKTKVCTFEHFKPEGMKVQVANNKPTLNCDKVPSNTFSTQWNNSEGIESITQHNGGHIVLSITREKLSTQDSAGLNLYLQSKPLTIQYELETPIVSTIDVQGFPYAYTNGHVQLSSGSIEQSLTPKVEYSLSANKTGQIDSNTRQVIRQQNKLDDFEAMMLTAMVQSAYDKAILQFDYEMRMMSLGGE